MVFMRSLMPTITAKTITSTPSLSSLNKSSLELFVKQLVGVYPVRKESATPPSFLSPPLRSSPSSSIFFIKSLINLKERSLPSLSSFSCC
ncbi:hypothetical protein LguiA_007285 [Lonicera macranthoides]